MKNNSYPFSVINKNGNSPFVVLCDHASHNLPISAGKLGLTAHQVYSHIGWDIGALAVARQLALDLDAPLVYPRYSRLYIDCNRPPESTELIPLKSGGITVPGNHNLTPNQRQNRLDCCFWPYHYAIEALIEERICRIGRQFILSMHSFTPRLNGVSRHWDIGVTYLKANPLSGYLLTALSKSKDLVVGDNKPYNVTWQTDYSIPVHAAKRDLPHVLLEIRQDLVDENTGQLCYARLLLSALAGFPATWDTPAK